MIDDRKMRSVLTGIGHIRDVGSVAMIREPSKTRSKSIGTYKIEYVMLDLVRSYKEFISG